MSDKTVSILMSSCNGARWLPVVLDSVKNQTYPHGNIEILILDNASTDNSISIIGDRLSSIDYRLSSSRENLGYWAGFEKLLPQAKGEYVIALTDVVLDPHFIERAVAIMYSDPKIGALQAKIYQSDSDLQPRTNNLKPKIIDTCGFRISRSRRITNIGHGETDSGQYDKQIEIFGVEGAAPVFRRSALEDCKISGAISYKLEARSWLVDPDYRVGPFGYGDDLDIAWRMRLFGWKQILAPNVIAYHNRSTTRGVAKTPILGQLHRLSQRRLIDIRKRRLDWSNVRFTIIKNDYIINILRDLPWILAREMAVFGYTALFEMAVFLEAGRFLRLLPKMLARRKEVMSRTKISIDEMHKWFH